MNVPHPPGFDETSRRLGQRGAFLLALAVFNAGMGLSWIFPTPEQARAQSTLWRDEVAPGWVWGGMWLAVAVWCVAAAFRGDDYSGFGAAIALKALWATFEVSGWIAGAVTQGYRPGLIWTWYAIILMFCARGLPKSAPPPAKGDQP